MIIRRGVQMYDSPILATLIRLQIMTKLSTISSEEMENLSEACECIQKTSASSGRGLSTGEKIDQFLTQQFLPANLGHDFKEHHVDEADFMILDHPVSFKTLRGSGDLAMCWSRNDDDDKPREIKECDHWKIPVIIYVRESNKWWKKYGPKKHWLTDEPYDKSGKAWWCQTIDAGLYLVNHEFGKKMEFKRNNKSNHIIDVQDVYRLIIDARENDCFVKMPNAVGKFPQMKFVFLENSGKRYEI